MTTSAHEPAEGNLERMGLTALGYPPFVTFFSANLTSNASWFIFGAALNTYIFQVTGSAQAVGIASFVYSLPFALFMLHAGLLADRFGSKRMVVLSLAGAGAAIIATGLLALTGSPLWALVALGCVMSTFQTLGAPAFISIVNDLVPPHAISSGVALTFLGFNVGRIIGGIVGGVLLAALSSDIVTSAALTIVVAGVMQSLPALPISRLRVTETVARATDHSMMRPLVDAASYAGRFPTLGLIILVSVAPGAIGLSYTFLLPVVIRDLGANPGTIGLMYVGGGIGGLLAGLTAEPLMRRVGHGRAIFVGMGLDRCRADRCRAVRGPPPGGRRDRRGAGRLRDLWVVEPLARPVAVAGSPARSGHVAVHAAVLGPDAVRRAGRRARRRTIERPLCGHPRGLRSSLRCGAVLFLVRPQIATLRIDRVAGTVTGRLEGSGYSRPAEI